MNELKPEVSSGRKFSAIWIIPVVAIAIGIYMVIHTMMTEGPKITISFKSANGVEPGKTKVRYRDVDIGLVEDVSLSEGRDKIVVTVKLDLDAKNMLLDDTRFWVVRARIGAGGISGISTILSGAYIQLDPGTGAPGKRHYVGLEEPPLTPGDAPGIRLVLWSNNARSVSAGDAVLFRGYKVGRIEAVTLDTDKERVRYNVFIDSPYDNLVTTSSRFWNISGVDIESSAGGIEVSTGSLETILVGGVAFDTLPGLPPGEKARPGASYRLNASFQALNDNPFDFGRHYVVEFRQSIRGLEPGAPVEYRGIKIGHVERVLLKELMSGTNVAEGRAIPVLIYIEPGRLGMADTDETVERLGDIVAAGIEFGLRASLQSGNLITGKLYINMDYFPDAEQVAAKEFEGYKIIPSIPGGLDRLEQQVSVLLEKLNALPLDTTVARANTVLGTMDGTMASATGALDSLRGLLEEDSTRQLTAELRRTLVELRQALESLEPGSPTGQSLSSSIFELNAVLRNLETLTRTLSDKPNAIIFPTDMPADPIPEARAR